MSMRLVWDKNRCTGCRVCEAICSLTKEGVFSPVKSRGKIVRTVEKNLLYKIRVHCMQCEEAACLAVCPSGAISSNADRVKIVDEDKCLGCRMCEVACPVGAIGVDSDTRVSQKCDLCQDVGEPQCAKYCFREALQYLPEDRIRPAMARAKSSAFLESMEKASQVESL